jgi:hypothetical protein
LAFDFVQRLFFVLTDGRIHGSLFHRQIVAVCERTGRSV